ncbi:MAG: hypothetical protein JW787_01505 [Sedimentisphaerales bacterium]|nr:hypothetical protein [Sedimentisphaerales bacterium]
MRIFSLVVLTAFIITTMGCGYILYPERRHAKLSNEIDAKVVLFDCLWLIAGVIPGVVALVIDAASDTWYYTEDEWNDIKSESSINIQPGQQLEVDIHGLAPTDAKVTLSLLDNEGRQVTSIAEAYSTSGKDLAPLKVKVPQQLDQGGLALVLAVNDQQQCRWNLDVMQK